MKKDKLFSSKPHVSRKREMSSYVFLPKYIKEKSLEANGNFFCYQATKYTQILTFVVLLILFLDYVSDLNMLLNMSLIKHDISQFVVIYMNIMGKVGAAIAVIYYMRFRGFSSLKGKEIPIWISVKKIRDMRQYEFILSVSFIFLLVLGILLLPQLNSTVILKMYHLQNNIWAVSLWQCVLLFILPMLIGLVISLSLLLEKAALHFDELKSEMGKLYIRGE